MDWVYDKYMALHSQPNYKLHGNWLLCSVQVISRIVAVQIVLKCIAISDEYQNENSVQNT